MNAPSRHEKEIFNDALELTPAEAHQAYTTSRIHPMKFFRAHGL